MLGIVVIAHECTYPLRTCRSLVRTTMGHRLITALAIVPWDGVNTPPLGKYAIVRKTKFTNALLEISDKISRYYTSYEQLHSLRVDVVKWNP